MCHRLMKPSEMKVDHIPKIIAASCVLHNKCEIHGECFDYAWLEESQSVSQFHQPSHSATRSEECEAEAHQIREVLVQYLHAE